MDVTIKTLLIPEEPKTEALFSPMWDQIVGTLYQHSRLENFPIIALDCILSVIPASAGSFFLWDETQKEFVLKAARGPYRDKMQDTHVKLREGILGWVGMQGASILVKDVHADQRIKTLKRFDHYKSYSFISIPLISKNRLLGVVNITERQDLMAFSEENLQNAQTFSKHIATAYTQLKENTSLRKENLELLQEMHDVKNQLKTQEPFVALGKLAAKLAHELNNPLDAIRRYVNLAMDHSLEDSLTKEYLTKAKKGIRRSVRIIRHLLHFMSAYKESVRPVDIHELLEQSLEIAEDTAFQEITFLKDFCNMPALVQDRGLILVFHNLYQNAQHAMRGKGTITISTHRIQDQLTILIEDTGVGIPDGIQRHLFEPLFSTKNSEEGTGMGLSLSREIIQRCGGTIACDAAAQKGARFVITLPCLPKVNSK